MLTVSLLIKSLMIIKQSSIVKMFPIHLNNQYNLLCVLKIVFKNIYFYIILSRYRTTFKKKKGIFNWSIHKNLKIEFRTNIL